MYCPDIEQPHCLLFHRTHLPKCTQCSSKWKCVCQLNRSSTLYRNCSHVYLQHKSIFGRRKASNMSKWWNMEWRCTNMSRWAHILLYSGCNYLPSSAPGDCGELESIENGEVAYNESIGTGTVATYICSMAYTLRGSEQRECLINATWSGSEPTCGEIKGGRTMGSFGDFSPMHLSSHERD